MEALTVKQAMEELSARTGSFLPYQWGFIFDPAEEVMCAAGFGVGKSHAGCYKGILLNSIFPGNRGLIGRFHGSDMDDSVIPLFFDICPPSWIRAYNKQQKVVTMKNNSQVLFRHLHDAKAAGVKTRRVGANLGWAFIDQAEECLEAHWNAMIGRLRLPAAKKRFMFGTMNPNGHDWGYRRFFRGVGAIPPDKHLLVRNGSTLGIAVQSEVNRKTRGGFVDDRYFDNMLRTYPREWIERWLYCSFDEFSGKIYREYDLNSIHNLRSFPIPSHWNHIISIDVGGDAPWAVLDNVIDEFGNVITANEFYKSSVNVNEVAQWIKSNTPWNSAQTLYVIDWENKLAMLELQDHGIICRPAYKKVHAGILRTGGYVHVRPEEGLPQWYMATQSDSLVHKFTSRGSPRWFVFADKCPNTCREHDGYV